MAQVRTWNGTVLIENGDDYQWRCGIGDILQVSGGKRLPRFLMEQCTNHSRIQCRYTSSNWAGDSK